MAPGVDWASNRNKYPGYLLEGKGGRCVGLTTLSLSYADCLEILGVSTFCSQACNGIALSFKIHYTYNEIRPVVCGK